AFLVLAAPGVVLVDGPGAFVFFLVGGLSGQTSAHVVVDLGAHLLDGLPLSGHALGGVVGAQLRELAPIGLPPPGGRGCVVVAGGLAQGQVVGVQRVVQPVQQLGPGVGARWHGVRVGVRVGVRD